MNSPITGSPMTLKSEKSTLEYKGIKCVYTGNYWECPDTKEQFTTTEIDEEHLKQIKEYYENIR